MCVPVCLGGDVRRGVFVFLVRLVAPNVPELTINSPSLPPSLPPPPSLLPPQGGGGPFTCISYENKGPLPIAPPVFSGHTSNVLDFDFSPFHDHLIASASEDTSVKLWGIPEGGMVGNKGEEEEEGGRERESLTLCRHHDSYSLSPHTRTRTAQKTNISTPLADLRGHERKVTLVKFHPTAANVLASVSADGMVKLWDVEAGREGGSCDVHQQLVQDVQWDWRGETFATTSKDKVLRVIDGRTGAVAAERKEAHEGTKSSKCVWLGDRGLLLTVGFTKQSRRQVREGGREGGKAVLQANDCMLLTPRFPSFPPSRPPSLPPSLSSKCGT